VNKFEEFVRKIIPTQLPIAYVEGHRELNEQINSRNWPKRPKLMWTSNSFFMDEMFKMWAADRVEEGVPLVIGQHGGHYGQGLFSFTEDHELKICDRYLSWGWSNGDDKVLPVGTVKRPIRKKKNTYQHGTVLFIISGTSRYCGGIASMPICRQWTDYMDDQIKFYKNLPTQISKKMVVRLYPHDYEWSQYDRWKDIFPESSIDHGNRTFNKALATAQLFVSGWNTTTYLESMISDVPTIVFWNPNYFELRKDAKIDFNELKNVGILHDCPISAAEHLEDIWFFNFLINIHNMFNLSPKSTVIQTFLVSCNQHVNWHF